MKKHYSKPTLEITELIEDVLASSQPVKDDNRKFNADDFGDFSFGGSWESWAIGGIL